MIPLILFLLLLIVFGLRAISGLDCWLQDRMTPSQLKRWRRMAGWK